MFLGEGVGFKGGALENKGKGEGGGEGGGWGGDRRRNRQVKGKLCRNYPLANYPFFVAYLSRLALIKESENRVLIIYQSQFLGKSKRGPSKRGLPKKGPFRTISALPP